MVNRTTIQAQPLTQTMRHAPFDDANPGPTASPVWAEQDCGSVRAAITEGGYDRITTLRRHRIDDPATARTKNPPATRSIAMGSPVTIEKAS